MKVLSTNEVNNVSGGLILGSIFGAVGSAMGSAIGGIVDAGCASGGYQTNFKESGSQLGHGIGAIVGLSPIMATKGIGAGVTGIVNNARSIKAQKRGF
ncbi:MAG TPA: hypothetical protein DIT05_16835 [Morganella sp. (in: Bacteria)]|nr:hypothetical protein [Morganella sp. (in: enterobacteria)]